MFLLNLLCNEIRPFKFRAKIAFRVILLNLLCNEIRSFKFPITGIRETTRYDRNRGAEVRPEPGDPGYHIDFKTDRRQEQQCYAKKSKDP